MLALTIIVTCLNRYTSTKSFADALLAGNKEQITAEFAKFVAEQAVQGAVAAALRPVLPAVRLGLTITGNSALWPALGTALGMNAGNGVGWFIDW